MNMNDILQFINENFWTAAIGLGSVSTVITGAINGWAKPTKTVKRIISWGVAIALTIAGYFLNIVEIGEPKWLALIMMGLVVGLSSNGLYSIPQIRNFVNNLTGEEDEKK